MKKCSKCGELKPLTAYYRAGGNSREGLRGDCIPCNLASKAERHRLNPEPARRRTRAWRLANLERANANQQAFVASGGKRLSDRKSHLKRKYGMTLEQYQAMLDSQGGGCLICGRPPRDDISLHVDHDHSTGNVRGILCFCCNNALADFQDNPELLRKAASYVTSHDPEAQEEIRLARARALSLVGSGGGRAGG
jgi:5-methylcytosine-specific restriction endonuclease McrA